MLVESHVKLKTFKLLHLYHLLIPLQYGRSIVLGEHKIYSAALPAVSVARKVIKVQDRTETVSVFPGRLQIFVSKYETQIALKPTKVTLFGFPNRLSENVINNSRREMLLLFTSKIWIIIKLLLTVKRWTAVKDKL